jgi:hypothetical protein
MAGVEAIVIISGVMSGIIIRIIALVVLVLMPFLIMIMLLLHLGTRVGFCSRQVGQPPPATPVPFWQEKWQDFPFPTQATGKSRKIAGKIAG